MKKLTSCWWKIHEHPFLLAALISEFANTSYPLVNIQKTMENHHFQWVNPLFLWPFSSSLFVCLPEGKHPFSYGFPMVFLWFSHSNLHFPMVFLRYAQLLPTSLVDEKQTVLETPLKIPHFPMGFFHHHHHPVLRLRHVRRKKTCGGGWLLMVNSG